MKLFRPLCLILAILLFLLSFSACAKEEAAVNEWKPAEIEKDLKAAVAQLPGTELEFKLLFEDHYFRCDWSLIGSEKEAKAFLGKWKKEKENEKPYLSLKKIDFDTYYLLVCPRGDIEETSDPFLLDLVQQEDRLVLVYQFHMEFEMTNGFGIRGITSFVLIKKSDWIYGDTLPDIYTTCYDKNNTTVPPRWFKWDPIMPETRKRYPRENTNN